jgi:hypothetical protein
MNDEEKRKKLERLEIEEQYVKLNSKLTDVYVERKFSGRLKPGDEEAMSRTVDIVEEEKSYGDGFE